MTLYKIEKQVLIVNMYNDFADAQYYSLQDPRLTTPKNGAQGGSRLHGDEVFASI